MSDVQKRISAALAALGDEPPQELAAIREALLEARIKDLSGEESVTAVVTFEPYEAREIAQFREDVMRWHNLSQVIRGLVMDNQLMLERRDPDYVNPLFR